MNDSTKHTPGPWELDPPAEAHVTSEDYHVIRAGCGFLAEAKGEREPGFRISGYMSPADSRLITAAPDLVAALKSLRDGTQLDNFNRNDDGLNDFMFRHGDVTKTQFKHWVSIIDAALSAAGIA